MDNPFKIWSGIFRINIEGKSMIKKSSPGILSQGSLFFINSYSHIFFGTYPCSKNANETQIGIW